MSEKPQDAKVVGLKGGVPSQVGEPREKLIATIEELLEKARSGELQSFVGTGFVSSGSRLASWCDFHENTYEMLGSLAWLQHEYVERHTST